MARDTPFRARIRDRTDILGCNTEFRFYDGFIRFSYISLGMGQAWVDSFADVGLSLEFLQAEAPASFMFGTIIHYKPL